MRIHWTAKWISIPYESRTVAIQGILSELIEGVSVESQPPPDVQQLLLTYADVFAAKVSYPPPRSCTHTLPLIPGARPMSIHSYCYAHALKDEIECQVQEML
jgi:hypothetical protein